MMQTAAQLIPAIDPAPLPAPVWLFQVLLVVTFLIHLVFMNLMLGSSVLAGYSFLRERRVTDGRWRRYGSELMQQLPWHIAFTVTTGIAPLLFVQVLYGPLFYSATISMGGIWISLLLIIVAAYYAAYLYQRSAYRPGAESGRPVWAWAAALLFLVAALIQVAVNVLQITPGRWLAVYQGTASGFTDLSVLPRYLHFLLAAIAFTGLYTALRGAGIWGVGSTLQDAAGEEAAAYRSWSARLGCRLAFWTTAVQVAIGFWLLLTLPSAATKGLVTGNGLYTAYFIIGVFLAVGLVIMLGRLERPVEQKGLLKGSAALLVMTMLGMVLIRDGARQLSLAQWYSIWDLPVRSQTGVSILFFVLFVAGLVLLGLTLAGVRRELRGNLDAPRPRE